MRVSAKVDYACRALLELSFHWPNQNPLPVTEIARRQRIPLNFLTQILLVLKHLGLVRSIRGKAGGYVLTKPPKEITLGVLVRYFPELRFSDAQNKKEKSVPANVFGSIWHEFDDQLQSFTDRISFEDICQKERALQDVPIYAI
jgi:Rrf2 family protein